MVHLFSNCKPLREGIYGGCIFKRLCLSQQKSLDRVFSCSCCLFRCFQLKISSLPHGPSGSHPHESKGIPSDRWGRDKWNDEGGWCRLFCVFGMESEETFHSRAKARISLIKHSLNINLPALRLHQQPEVPAVLSVEMHFLEPVVPVKMELQWRGK